MKGRENPSNTFRELYLITSLHVPNNHLDIPNARISRWPRAAQRLQMWRGNLAASHL